MKALLLIEVMNVARASVQLKGLLVMKLMNVYVFS